MMIIVEVSVLENLLKHAKISKSELVNKTSQSYSIYSMTTKMVLLTMTNSFTKSEEKSRLLEWMQLRKLLIRWIKIAAALLILMSLRLVMMLNNIQMSSTVRELNKMFCVNIWKHLRLIIYWEQLKTTPKWQKRNSLNTTRTFLLALILTVNFSRLSTKHPVLSNNQTTQEKLQTKDNQQDYLTTPNTNIFQSKDTKMFSDLDKVVLATHWIQLMNITHQ